MTCVTHTYNKTIIILIRFAILKLHEAVLVAWKVPCVDMVVGGNGWRWRWCMPTTVGCRSSISHTTPSLISLMEDLVMVTVEDDYSGARRHKSGLEWWLVVNGGRVGVGAVHSLVMVLWCHVRYIQVVRGVRESGSERARKSRFVFGIWVWMMVVFKEEDFFIWSWNKIKIVATFSHHNVKLIILNLKH